MTDAGRDRSARDTTGVPDNFVLESFVPYMLNQIFSQMNEVLRQALKPYRVSIHQWRVLCFLKLHGELSIGDISANTVMGQSTISRVVDQLEANGYAVRRPMPRNNRVILVSLTESGDEVIETVFPVAVSVHHVAMEDFSPVERERFLAMLHRVLGNLQVHGAVMKVNGMPAALSAEL